jgi:uncharacterized membrane protein YphA (DoxX/SURF4 family)
LIKTHYYYPVKKEEACMHPIQSFVAFLGRALLSIIFISSGIHKIADWQPTLQLFDQTLTDWLAISVGDSFFQPLIEWGLAHSSGLLVLGVLFELVGGLLVFLGFWVRLGSFATTTFHPSTRANSIKSAPGISWMSLIRLIDANFLSIILLPFF